jgi:hypothetical protein
VGLISKVSVDVAFNLVVGSMIGGVCSMMEGAGKNIPIKPLCACCEG